MICNKCKTKADRLRKPGCDTPCGDKGCLCQHRGAKTRRADVPG